MPKVPIPHGEIEGDKKGNGDYATMQRTEGTTGLFLGWPQGAQRMWHAIHPACWKWHNSEVKCKPKHYLVSYKITRKVSGVLWHDTHEGNVYSEWLPSRKAATNCMTTLLHLIYGGWVGGETGLHGNWQHSPSQSKRANTTSHTWSDSSTFATVLATCFIVSEKKKRIHCKSDVNMVQEMKEHLWLVSEAGSSAHDSSTYHLPQKWK